MTDFTKVRESLEHKGFKVSVFAHGEDAAKYLEETIYEKTVGFGGSKTAAALGLYEVLEKNNYMVWHWKAADYENLTKDDTAGLKKIHEARNAAMRTDVYICSANALSEDGVIVNIDGAGNRISSTLWGHKKVIFVIGKNKIVPTYEDAVFRARNVAAPLRARSMHKKTPCAQGELKCYDCDSPQRICRGMATIWYPMQKQEFEILLIDEDLGM